MIETTDICHGCKNQENSLTCVGCCHGKEDRFEPIEEVKEEIDANKIL
jgi:hypothetical protein